MLNGNKIASYIKKMKITQEELANDAGLTKPTISKMINRHTCNLNSLIAIANVMNVSLDYLCDRLEGESIQVNGSKNQVGSGNVIMELQATEIEHLNQLLEEKERTIQILMSK